MVYRQVMTLVDREVLRKRARSRRPWLRVNAILDDVKDVTAKVKTETERVDHAIRTTIDRVDDTADRVRSNVRAKTSRSSGWCAALGWRSRRASYASANVELGDSESEPEIRNLKLRNLTPLREA